MSLLHRVVLVAGLSLSAGCASAQMWTMPSSGSWFTALNWTPMMVPNGNTVVADVTVGGMPYTASIAGGNVVLSSLAVGTDATIAIETQRLTIWGGSLTNNGTIVVNAAPGFNGALWFSDSATASLTGTGTVVLNANANSFTATISRGAFDPTVLTIGAGQTITGRGIVSIPFTNNGTISADADLMTLSTGFSAPTSSPGTLEAMNGGQLDLRNIDLDLAGTGVINIDNAELRFNGGTFAQRVRNGTINTTNGGLVRSVTRGDFLDTVLNGDAVGDLRRGFRFYGSFFENNGSLTVTGDGVNGFTALEIHDTPYAFTGVGEMVLQHPPMTNPNASPGITQAISGVVLTNGATHTIRGKGRLVVETNNSGTIIADDPGETFDLLAPVHNTGLLRATNGGTLQFASDIVQTGAGVVELDNGFLDVLQANPRATFDGGSIVGTNGGKIRIRSGNGFFSNATLDTDTDVLGQFFHAEGGITNNGSMLVQFDGGNFGFLRIELSQTWDGTGEIVLNADAENLLRYAQITRNAPGDTLTHAATHTIRGTGEINVAVDNRGLIVADVPDRTLLFQLEDKLNSGIVRAADGILAVAGVTVDQTDTGNGAGLMETTGNGEIRFSSVGSVIGGTLDGTLRSIGPGGVFDGVVLNGLLSIEGSAAHLRGAIENNGTIRVDQLSGAFPGFGEIEGTVELNGTGELRFNPVAGTGAQLRNTAPGATLVNGVDHTIRGTGQFVGLTVENRGVLAPGRVAAGGEIGEFAYTNTTDIVCDSTGRVRLDVQGTAPGEFDRIFSFGAATSTFHCAGTLEVQNVNGYPGLTFGDGITIINAPGGLTGTFDSVVYPGQANVEIVYEPTQVRLVFACLADVNEDDKLDIFDITTYLDLWAAGDPEADLDSDGALTIFDIIEFLNRWNAGCA